MSETPEVRMSTAEAAGAFFDQQVGPETEAPEKLIRFGHYLASRYLGSEQHETIAPHSLLWLCGT